jgi:TetR/AcrR family transcriptional repressor of mexJK operon
MPTTRRRGPGRPRDDGLRERIVDAARRLLTAHGAKVSLERIAEAAGTSKVTLYSHFPTKDALFAAVMDMARSRTIGVSLAAATPDDLEASLHAVAKAYIELITSQDVAAITVVLLHGAADTPQLAKAFFNSGPQMLTDSLATYLRSVPGLRIDSYEHAAEQFIGMIRGSEHLRALLKLPPAQRGKARDAYLKSCIELFLRGYLQQSFA